MAAEDGHPRGEAKGPADQDGEAAEDGAEPSKQKRVPQDEHKKAVPAREPDRGEAADRGDGADALQQEESGAGRAEASRVRAGSGGRDEGDGAGQSAGPGPAGGGGA